MSKRWFLVRDEVSFKSALENMKVDRWPVFTYLAINFNEPFPLKSQKIMKSTYIKSKNYIEVFFYKSDLNWYWSKTLPTGDPWLKFLWTGARTGAWTGARTGSCPLQCLAEYSTHGGSSVLSGWRTKQEPVWPAASLTHTASITHTCA